jgi:hypothetical protein
VDDSLYRQLDIGQWSWEFLRRNPEYRADYAEFIDTWRTLEADYGIPPDRDFFRWKQDPRASRSAWDPSLSTGAACTTDDEDRQLIECWMGAKWGFYQFPQNPALNALELEAPINWRPPPAFNLHGQASCPECRGLNFDLRLPLPHQLEAARQWLIGEQIKLRRQNHIVPHSLENQRDHWQTLVYVLDMGDSSHAVWNEAMRMTQRGYREILWLRRSETSTP